MIFWQRFQGISRPQLVILKYPNLFTEERSSETVDVGSTGQPEEPLLAEGENTAGNNKETESPPPPYEP